MRPNRQTDAAHKPKSNGTETALTAFTNEAVLKRLDHELAEERDRVDRQRAEDRKADADRLASIESDIREMRDLLFEAFQRGKSG